MNAPAVPPISTDVYVIPYEGAHLVYAPLRRLAFVANAAAVNTLAKLKAGVLDQPTADEAAFLEFAAAVRLTGSDGDAPIVGLNQPEFCPNEITLFLTADCNLRCVYCYARAGDTPASRMTLETARRGIDQVVANALALGLDWIGVNYHGGGEPTLNHEVLTASHAYARQQAERHGLKLHTAIATNGVLSPRGRRWIIENLDGASISLDGSPAVNDLNRPNRAGGGSGSLVMTTLREMDAAGFAYSLRVTVSAQTVQSMVETVTYILDETHPRRIQIEPVYDIGRGADAGLHVDADAFIGGFRRCRALANSRGVDLAFSSARIEVVTNRFCRAYGEGFSLTPAGAVTGCYEVYDQDADFADDVIFGRYDEAADAYIFDPKKLGALRDHTVEKQSWCDGCFARWHCAGDCPNKVRHASVNGEFCGTPSCQITRALVQDQIITKIEADGGLIWMGAVDTAVETSDASAPVSEQQ